MVSGSVMGRLGESPVHFFGVYMLLGMKASRFSPLVFCAFFVFSTFSAEAEAPVLRDGREALEVLAQRHREAAAFSLSFESRAIGADGNPMPAAKGTLVAADSGRFRLRYAQGTIVSDGKTLWQYFPSTDQVVLRAATESGTAGGVLLRFLQARAVKAEKKGGAFRLVLDPASVGENLDSLILTLSPDAATVRSVETQDPAGNRVVYRITSLRYDARPGRGTFTFRIPAGVEVVDMR